MHRHIVLDCPVRIPTALQTRRIGEKSGRDGALDGDQIRAAAGGQGDFDAIAEFGELVSDVAGAGEGALLEEVLAGPDERKVRVDPLIPDIEVSEVVAAFFDGEAGAGSVGLEFFVFGAVEERAGFAEHGDDGEDFFHAAFFVGGEDGFGEHGVCGKFGHLAPDFGEFAFVV